MTRRDAERGQVTVMIIGLFLVVGLLTVVVVEHVMRAVMSLSDRIVVLDQGSQIAEGTPQEIAGDPRVIQAYLGKEYQRA